MNKKRYIAFTGTRNGMTDLQKESLRSLVARLSVESKLLVSFRHGACIGADRQFHDIVQSLGAGAVEIHPGDESQREWAVKNTRPCLIFETKSYLSRNRDMVDMSDVLIACPHENSEQLRSGTWATIRYARDSGRPTIIINRDGKFGGTGTDIARALMRVVVG